MNDTARRNVFARRKLMMKKLVALLMALVMLLSVASALAEDVITLKIAHIGPTTGAAALYGLATLHGAEVAAAEVNEAGGKYKIELINEDDEHNVEKVINAYNAALDAGAQMILGSTTSKPCEAAGAQGYVDRVFFLTPSASSTAVIEDKDNVFQICFTDPNQGKASAQYIAEHKLGTKVAVIYNNADVYSTGIRDTFVEEVNAAGGKYKIELINEDDEHNVEKVINAYNAALDAGAQMIL
ncbi:MAG: ABC transporter substrate-binding protein, partial [Clostridia bacterium]|nr:ABC transporter substrate-binding protein [Clostridia bacterium]